MKIKRTKHDAVFSDLVRIRTLECERCHFGYPDFPDIRDKSFQNSHYVSRGVASLRFFPGNCFALCGSCHFEVGRDPGEHYKFVFGQLGEVLFDELMQKKQTFCRRRKADMEELYQHYRAEYKRLVLLRKGGENGRIEFIGYD